jgi:cell fate (sporulation/competence/biofilm development) regulator YmcA (YheA/YmcA/DUF963 family)
MMELPHRHTTPADMAHSTDEVEFFRLMEAELKRGSRLVAAVSYSAHKAQVQHPTVLLRARMRVVARN